MSPTSEPGNGRNSPVAMVQGRPVDAGEAFATIKESDALPAVRRALQSLAIDEQARQRGLSVADAELQEAADALRRQRGLHKASDTQRWLEMNGLDADGLERLIERRLLRRKLQEQVVPQDQVEVYFAEHKSTFDRAELSEIRVDEQGKADELAAQLRDEEADFLQLATRYAHSDAAKRSGGYVGWVARKALSPEVEAVVFAASADEIAGPVQTDAGWHILKVWEVQKAKLDERMVRLIRDRLFEEWVRQQVGEVELTV